MRMFRRKDDKATEVPTISIRELKKRLESAPDTAVLDVRQPAGYEAYPGEIPGSVRIPPSELPERYGELPRDRPIVVYCT
jgi:rhodanese-related sulfurtransferase